jgi:predicted DNA-binding transcriptional regulator YafY
MSRAARLLDLIELLRRHRAPVTAEALAANLGVSIRTLYRDIATLQGQGAEIAGEPGVGYVLKPGFMLPPLMFSVDEIEAVVLGSRWVAARSDDPRLGEAAKNAVAKIAAVLPKDLRATVDAETMLVPRVGRDAPAVDVGILREAIRKETKLRIGYRDEAGAATDRVIWPFVIGFFEQHRVVVAWCELRADYRHFRIDRISSAVATGERAPRRRQAMLKEWREKEGILVTARN